MEATELRAELRRLLHRTDVAAVGGLLAEVLSEIAAELDRDYRDGEAAARYRAVAEYVSAFCGDLTAEYNI